ncbi:response regulator [Neobacillus sp. MM2021_6]|uniref:response regulator n=1 Tax=Bacillaceae TaxID=186817 RepID=UPI0014092434|nr:MULTISPECIES: response regulator [Bacillaceae]MBO0959005.1 response regulator [Neobacillus sp. MM2021_6]NHC17735.1 response regulator [Bacillus sp. MM2020_4]
MKIKTKLLLGLSSKPLIIILIILFGMLQITSLNKLNNLSENNYDLSLLAEQIQKEVKDEAISLRNLVIFDNQDSFQKELSNITTISERVSHDIAQLDSKTVTKEQKMMVNELKETNIQFNLYKNNVIDLLSKGKKNDAVQLIDDNGHSIHDKLFKEIQTITANFEANMKSSFSSTIKDVQRQVIITSLISLISIIISSGFIIRIVWSFANRLRRVSKEMQIIANGQMDVSTKVEVISHDEIDDVALSFNKMVESLVSQRIREQRMLWNKSNIAEVTTSLSGVESLEALSQTFLSKVIPLLDASHGVLYGKDDSSFTLLASYALTESKQHPVGFNMGEGLLGQAALEKSPIILEDVPPEYIKIKSGLGEESPRYLVILPILFEGDVKGVLEFASFNPMSKEQSAFLEEIVISFGIILESVYGRIKLAHLLEESQVLTEEVQAQSEELQAQQEELIATNEELEEQTQALRQSEEILQQQQEELEHTNVELKEKAAILEEQNKRFELTNREVEKARAELEEKANQLAISSKYKSEFLANMSHELRTPLNSLLILSKLLADNQEGNLNEKQVNFSKTIYSSGSDLLALINDILDLAKIESGKMTVNPSKVFINDLVEFVENSFRPIAIEKDLDFTISIQDDLPPYINSDEQRLQQILRNLLSNAFKFTKTGEVILEIGLLAKPNDQSMFVFSIIDTGIGIAKDKQELIFEAFQQADGTTSRRFGGTGLGLSICREISNLLNGEIVVESEQGKGSRFSFYVRDSNEENKMEELQVSMNEVAVSREITVNSFRGIDETPEKGKKKETIEDNNDIKRLLIVDDDVRQRNSLMELMGEKNVIIRAVSSGSEALEELKLNNYDFMILDLGLTDINGIDLLGRIKSNTENENLNVFIYTGRDLSVKEEILLMKYTNTIIIKDQHSLQRLNDELELYLKTSNEKVEVSHDEGQSDEAVAHEALKGKRILLVDDDVRNVFALMSFLEQYQLDITFAENGRESIEVLEKSPAFDIILMDIMMPEMDGYEAIRRIRDNPEFSTLPIIALTAKAMKEDREKCMEAGASDYIVKPFDPDQLMSLIRVWLYQ